MIHTYKYSARQTFNPGEKLEGPNPGWPFYRGLLKMARIWKVKKRTKSAVAILLKAEKMGAEMLLNSVGPDLKKMKPRRVNPEQHVRNVAKWETNYGRWETKGLQRSERSVDWWIEPRLPGKVSCFRVHDLATSEVWKFQPNFEDAAVAKNIDRQKGDPLQYRSFRMSGRFLFCWARANVPEKAVKGQFNVQLPEHMLIVDLATKRQHWLFHSKSFGTVTRTNSFKFDCEKNKLEFECVHWHCLYFDCKLRGCQHMLTKYSYETSLPELKTTVVSTVKVPYKSVPKFAEKQFVHALGLARLFK